MMLLVLDEFNLARCSYLEARGILLDHFEDLFPGQTIHYFSITEKVGKYFAFTEIRGQRRESGTAACGLAGIRGLLFRNARGLLLDDRFCLNSDFFLWR